LAALITIGGAAVAPAHTARFATSFKTIEYVPESSRDGVIRGQIASPKAACEKGRTVRVEQRLGSIGSLFGTTKTDADGNFSLEVNNVRSNEFAAEVTKKTLVSNTSHRHKCKAKVVVFSG
jgi:hypothetical protein